MVNLVELTGIKDKEGILETVNSIREILQMMEENPELYQSVIFIASSRDDYFKYQYGNWEQLSSMLEWAKLCKFIKSYCTWREDV